MSLTQITPGKPLPKGQKSQYETKSPGTKLDQPSIKYKDKVAEARKKAIAEAVAKGQKITTQQEEELKAAGITAHPGGYTETITTSNPKATINEAQREKELIKASEQGRSLTQQQQEELKAIRRRGIALNYQQVNDLNEWAKEQGIGTGKEFFKATKEGRIKLEATTNEQGITELSNITVTTNKKELYTIPKTKETNELYTPKSEEYEQTPGQRTNINEGKKELKYYFPVQSTVRMEQQEVTKPWVQRGMEAGKRLFYTNVEQPYLTGKSNEFIFAAGSFFYGLQNVGFSIWRTFEGNTLKNIATPWDKEAQGFIPETIQSISHPVTTTKNIITKGISNPYELAGELYGTKSIFEAISPIKSITIEKMPIPKLIAKTSISKAGEKNTVFEEGTGTIIKGVKVESKILGLQNTRFSTKIIGYFENPKYTQYLNNNPMYRELQLAEIIIPKEPTETIYTRIIEKNERGETVIRTVKETKPSEAFREIDSADVFDPQLKQFIKNKPQSEGEFTSGGAGRSEGLDKSPFKTIGDLNKPGGGLGNNNPFSGITAVTEGNRKLILIEPETETTQIIRLGDIMKQEGTIKPQISIYNQNKLNSLSSNVQAQANKQESITGTRNISTTSTKNALIQHQQIINTQGLKVIQTTKTTQSSKTATKTAQAQVQVQEIAQAQVQISGLKVIQITPIKIIPPVIYKSKNKESKKSIFGGYNVEVKSKGIFTKINNKPLDLKSALKKGSETVERTPSATFKITSPENPGGIFTSSTPKGFYKKGNLFIEKPSRRINTAGELFGITSKGRTSKRIKKLYGG